MVLMLYCIYILTMINSYCMCVPFTRNTIFEMLIKGQVENLVILPLY